MRPLFVSILAALVFLPASPAAGVQARAAVRGPTR